MKHNIAYTLVTLALTLVCRCLSCNSVRRRQGYSSQYDRCEGRD